MKQYLRTYYHLLFTFFIVLLVPLQTLATWYSSSQSGDWQVNSTWSPTGVPVSGDGVNLLAAHTITYSGNFNWNTGQISIYGTMIVHGDLILDGSSTLYIYGGGELIVDGNLTINNNLSISGTLTVGENLTVNGSLYNKSTLHVGGNTIINNTFTNDENAVVDLDGDLLISNGSFYENSGMVVVSGDLTKYHDLSASGILVVGGDYYSYGGNTWTQNDHFYVLGTSNCTGSNCGNIGNSELWEDNGSPGSAYMRPYWWENHLANAGNTVGPTDVCSSSVYNLTAVTENAGNMSKNVFEWAVYGGTISANNGGTQIVTNSGVVDSHTASVLSYYGISGQTTYTITVDWTDNNFTGAYVAVRQTSESGCADGKWSIYLIHTKQTEAPTSDYTQSFCSGSSHLVRDLVATGTNIKWYAAETGGVALASGTTLITGAYYASQTIGNCESNERFAVNVLIKNLVLTCPPDATAACFASLPVVNSFKQFFDLGGGIDNNCSDTTLLTISSKDVISTASGCAATRTYTVFDGTATAIDSCKQTFSLQDAIAPSLTCGEDLVSNPNSSCAASLTILAPEVSDACNFSDLDPVFYYYPANDNNQAKVEGSGMFTGIFPLGTTTIFWSITDDCGNTGYSNQNVEVRIKLTAISYDSGSTATGAGSGVNPMQTSTHTYQVDNAAAEAGFTYTWELLDGSGNAVSSSLYSITSSNGGTTIALIYGELLTTGAYTLKVTKSNGCSVSKTLAIDVMSNSVFDVSLLPNGNFCQEGETGTVSEISWDVVFPSVTTAPFKFDYAITLNGSAACSGTVSNIIYASSTVNHASGCLPGSPASPPFVVVSKSVDSYQVRLTYTISNITATDKAFGITILATDNYEVSDPDVSNNSESLNAYGLPDTPEIQTN